MWQAHGGQHQNIPATGRIFSKCWSGPHTSSNLELDRAWKPLILTRSKGTRMERVKCDHLRAKRCGRNLGNVTFRDREPPWWFKWDTTAMLSVLTIIWCFPRTGRKCIKARKTALSSRQFMCQERNSPLHSPRAGLPSALLSGLEFGPLRNRSSSFDGSSGIIGAIQREFRGGAGKHVHDLRVGRRRPRLLAARRESIR